MSDEASCNRSDQRFASNLDQALAPEKTNERDERIRASPNSDQLERTHQRRALARQSAMSEKEEKENRFRTLIFKRALIDATIRRSLIGHQITRTIRERTESSQFQFILAGKRRKSATISG